ncbi:cucumisin-like isoform X2 [Euphorbia lathyris]|uniref:cucumisin-like isoform X2 n=1 Tax=Euphorbia lathyris TaxID=212925 RepID=UPI0033132535
MGDRLKGDFSAAAAHTNILQDVVGSGASDFLLHSYHRSFNGFVAKLTVAEKRKLEGKEGVVSVFRSRKKQLHTTRSWDFMRFPLNVARATNGSDVIIGMLDTGIWPESESFIDEGFGPPPTKWKGTCQGNSNFTCNNKVIGARYYNSEGDLEPEDILSPRDTEGHGTHTASTAAGSIVQKASLLGLGEGIARGGLPSARIAVYKICWSDGCSDADILAAFDDAIADGVDIISLSVGGLPQYYFQDTIAIGAFHAMKNGVLTSNSAGNGGPLSETLSNFAPWALSVAASTIDRMFVSQVKLGNGATFEGMSLNTFDTGNTMYPIIYGGDAPNIEGDQFGAMLCIPGNLNRTLVEGKIVLCDVASDTEGVIDAGAAGTIMRVGDFKDIARAYDLPATSLSMSDQADIMDYLKSTSEPTATILKSGTYENELAPVMASFSSRGPNPVTRDIIKPDLTAPGVNILAAWTEAGPVSGSNNATVPFYIISGTSMSCPHASAAAAYVKSMHPTWSPDAIRSALMTTAYTMDVATNPDAEFGYGSGHINPAKAANPGLVYDAGEADYVKFLCGEGYTSKQLQLITGDANTCSEGTNGTVWDLNYPSFALSTKYEESITRIFHRTVTNIGAAKSSYKAIIFAPEGVQIEVEPAVLSFQSVGEKQAFVVTVKATMIKPMISGALIWDDGVHLVRSPIVAHINYP